MSEALDALLGPATGAAPAPVVSADGGEGLRRLMEFHPITVGAMVALIGAGLLMLLLAPDRHRRAIDRLGRNALAAYGLGAVVLLPSTLVFVFLLRHHIQKGLLASGALVLLATAVGLSVVARRLGERVWPERDVVAQTLLGLAGLILPLALPLPVGLLVVLVAAPLGLGAWLLGRGGGSSGG